MPRAAGGLRRSKGVGYISSTPRMFTQPCSTKLQAAPQSLPGEFQHRIIFTHHNIIGTKIIWWATQMLKFVNKKQTGWVMRTPFVHDFGNRYSYSQLPKDLWSNRGHLNSAMLDLILIYRDGDKIFIGRISKLYALIPFFCCWFNWYPVLF